MFRKFIEGLVFGSGFAIALVVIWTIGMSLVVPRVITSFVPAGKAPEFHNPSEAKVVEPTSSLPTDGKEFSFFSHTARMEIPHGGGILAMSPVATTKGSKRPSTYQLWLTESKLWQIRTTEEKVEVEELPYPPHAGMGDLDKIMVEKYGLGPSSMTVSAGQIAAAKTTGGGGQDNSLNGTLKVSSEGVVFVLPNPYET